MANAKPSRPEADQSTVPQPKGPGVKSLPLSDANNGYYRTRENKVVFRSYLPDADGTFNGDYHQHVVEGPNGELPEGLKHSEIKNDE